jgi:hypothetical protein
MKKGRPINGDYESALRAQVRRRAWPLLVTDNGRIVAEAFVWLSRGDDNWAGTDRGLLYIKPDKERA